MGVAQEGEKCIFMLCMEVAEEDMEVQKETVHIFLHLVHAFGPVSTIYHLRFIYTTFSLQGNCFLHHITAPNSRKKTKMPLKK